MRLPSNTGKKFKPFITYCDHFFQELQQVLWLIHKDMQIVARLCPLCKTVHGVIQYISRKGKRQTFLLAHFRNELGGFIR